MKINQYELKKTHSKYANINITLHRSYSTARSYSTSNYPTPLHIFTITNLHDKKTILFRRNFLSKK